MTELTFCHEGESRPVEVGTPVYDSDGQLVARVTAVDPDGTITIGAPSTWCACGHVEDDHDPDDGCGACAMAMVGPCHTFRPQS